MCGAHRRKNESRTRACRCTQVYKHTHRDSVGCLCLRRARVPKNRLGPTQSGLRKKNLYRKKKSQKINAKIHYIYTYTYNIVYVRYTKKVYLHITFSTLLPKWHSKEPVVCWEKITIKIFKSGDTKISTPTTKITPTVKEGWQQIMQELNFKPFTQTHPS